jgi:hypothetical protein
MNTRIAWYDTSRQSLVTEDGTGFSRNGADDGDAGHRGGFESHPALVVGSMSRDFKLEMAGRFLGLS